VDLGGDDDEELAELVDEVAAHFVEVAGDEPMVGRSGDVVMLDAGLEVADR